MSLFLSRLRGLLEESAKTQKEICSDLGIRNQKLSNWKTGYSEPNFDDLAMLANYFEVSTDYLLGYSDDFGNITIKEKSVSSVNAEEQALLNDFRVLSRSEKAQASEYVHYLAEKRGSSK